MIADAHPKPLCEYSPMTLIKPAPPTLSGWQQADGQKGIRNVLLVAYLVECAEHVARAIVNHFSQHDIQLIGFPGCYPNQYAYDMMRALCRHANVGGVVLVSLGCEGFAREALQKDIASSGRPCDLLVIQETGGTRTTINQGIQQVAAMRHEINAVPRCTLQISDLIVGTICGGSDGTSGITGNPAAGHCFDRLIDAGAKCIFEETGELIGCEAIMRERAETAELADEIDACMAKAARYYSIMGYGSFAPGNADGGLSTQEEKSMGAYCKSGHRAISGLLKPTVQPPRTGLYLLDVVPDGEPRFGFPNISDNAEIAELMACGAHLTLFVTGRGSVVGSAISPVIKICAYPETYQRLSDDMDVNAGRILNGEASIAQLGDQIFDLCLAVANGQQTCSERLGHQEFILTYKQFSELGPHCLPTSSSRSSSQTPQRDL